MGEQTDKPIVWHEYRRYKLDGVDASETFCGGRWYVTGEAPCEIADSEAAQELRNLPACEVDDGDVAAAAMLLGRPGLSVCRTKGRASWQ